MRIYWRVTTMTLVYSCTRVEAVFAEHWMKMRYDHDVDKGRPQISHSWMCKLATVRNYFLIWESEGIGRADWYGFRFGDNQASLWQLVYSPQNCNLADCRTSVRYLWPCSRTSKKTERQRQTNFYSCFYIYKCQRVELFISNIFAGFLHDFELPPRLDFCEWMVLDTTLNYPRAQAFGKWTKSRLEKNSSSIGQIFTRPTICTYIRHVYWNNQLWTVL